MHGIELGGEKSICFGADFFYTLSHPDKSRIPFYFKEHTDAGKYPEILNSLAGKLNEQQLENLAFGNVVRFMRENY